MVNKYGNHSVSCFISKYHGVIIPSDTIIRCICVLYLLLTFMQHSQRSAELKQLPLFWRIKLYCVYHLSKVQVTCESVTQSHPSPVVGHAVVYSCQGSYNKLSYFCRSVWGSKIWSVRSNTRCQTRISIWDSIVWGCKFESCF